MQYKCVVSLFVIVLFAACSPNNVKQDNTLKKYFDEYNVEGSFGLFDNGKGNFIIYNLSRYKDSAYLPASTFKIAHALIGLQTGKIINEKMTIKWDGITRFLPNGDTATNWNKDLTMEEAFKTSAVHYFQTIARSIGKDTMQIWLDSLGYGSKKITSAVDSFWLNNTLKIKADEQLGLVKKLYFKQLPFTKKAQDIVTKLMIQESNAHYTLAYKTGYGFKENGKALVWVVGWIEENKHPHFFVLNIEGEKSIDFITVRKKILFNILKQLGYTEGKM